MQPFTGRPDEWNALIAGQPDPHLLQTAEWAKVKSALGWQALPFVWRADPASGESENKIAACAMILKKTISLRGFASKICVLYCPKGPLMDWGDGPTRSRVMADIEIYSHRQGGIFFKMDPDVILGSGIPGEPGVVDDETGISVAGDLEQRQWRFSSSQIQFCNTVLVDLSPPEEEMLARMKQKTRYNIRLAEKKGVKIRTGTLDDLPMLYRMYAETSLRDGFVIRNQDYYMTVWTSFMNSASSEHSPSAVPLIAEVDGEPVAAVFLFRFEGRAYYLYGMSRDAHREKMPNHLLQWEAMRIAKGQGCRSYDMWGAPDDFNEKDPLWGVYKFKEGFGGKVVRTLGAWDYAPNLFGYKIYTEIMPRILDVMRNRGKRDTQHQLDH